MTAQFREILTLKGKKYGMVTEPLDPLIVREFNGQKEGFPVGIQPYIHLVLLAGEVILDIG
jgi:hypothetical protein